MNEVFISILATCGAALINFIATKLYQVITKRKKTFFWKNIDNSFIEFSWKDICLGTMNLKKQILESGYNPTMLVGIGRGGAIISSLLSGCLNNKHHIPFIALERKYQEKSGIKKALLYDDVKFSKDLERVILISGDLVTGQTSEVFHQFLSDLGAEQIRFLTFVMASSSNRTPDYFFKKTNVTRFIFPWMLSKNYSHDSRCD